MVTILALARFAEATELHVVVSSASGFEAGVGAGGVVLHGASGTFTLGADGALSARRDLDAMLPPGARRLDGNDAALVVYDGDGARWLLSLAPPAIEVLPAPMIGAERVLLDETGRPALALVSRSGWTVAISAAGPLSTPAANPVSGLRPEVNDLCSTMAPRGIGLDRGALLVSSVSCDAGDRAALLRWPAAGSGAPERTPLPAGIDVGDVVRVPGGALYVATRANGGTAEPAGVLAVTYKGAVMLPPIAPAVTAPRLGAAADRSLWALVEVLVTPDRFGGAVFRRGGDTWEHVPLPTVGGDTLDARELLIDRAGGAWVLAGGQNPPASARWLLGEDASGAMHILP